MNFSGILGDLKTTIIGVIIIGAVTFAMFKGLCTFDRWWEIVLIIIGLVAGSKLVLAGADKEL